MFDGRINDKNRPFSIAFGEGLRPQISWRFLEILVVVRTADVCWCFDVPGCSRPECCAAWDRLGGVLQAMFGQHVSKH